jgi:hypothetical protein
MLRLPVMEGVVERRLLVNYSADPQVVSRLLPARCARSWSGTPRWWGSA